MRLMRRWGFWCLLTGGALLGTLYCAVSVWATIDLGYDRTEEGRRIMESWGNASGVLLIMSVVLGGITIWTWRTGKRSRVESQSESEEASIASGQST